MARFAESGAKLITESKDAAARHWRSAKVDLGLAIAGGAVVVGDAEHNGLKPGHLTETGLKLDHPTLVGALAITGITAGVGLYHLRSARHHSRDAYNGELILRRNNIPYADPQVHARLREFYDHYQEPR